MRLIANTHITADQAGLFDCSRIYPFVESVKTKIEIRMTRKITAIVEEINQ